MLNGKSTGRTGGYWVLGVLASMSVFPSLGSSVNDFDFPFWVISAVAHYRFSLCHGCVGRKPLSTGEMSQCASSVAGGQSEVELGFLGSSRKPQIQCFTCVLVY